LRTGSVSSARRNSASVPSWDHKLLVAEQRDHRNGAPHRRVAEQLAGRVRADVLEQHRHDAERVGDGRAHGLVGLEHGGSELGQIGDLEAGAEPEALGERGGGARVKLRDPVAVRLGQRAQHTVHVVFGDVLLSAEVEQLVCKRGALLERQRRLAPVRRDKLDVFDKVNRGGVGRLAQHAPEERRQLVAGAAEEAQKLLLRDHRLGQRQKDEL
jgi:hypothetical protein